MKDNKPWYEKISIWITIIAGIMTVIVGIITISNNNQNDIKNSNNFNENTITTDEGNIIINYGDNNNFIEESSNDNKVSKINININSLELSYATLSDDRFKNVYIGEYTDLSILKEKYYLEDNCAFILNISNPTEHQIKINNFKIVTDNITQISEPHIIVELNLSEGINLSVSNHGWSNVNNLELTIDDKDNILSEYFGKDNLFIHIPELKAGEHFFIPFLNEYKLIKKPNINDGEYITIDPFVKIVIEDEEKEIQNLLPIYLYKDKVEIDVFGGNEGFYGVYGIMVDTRLSEYQKEFNINETIDAGEILDIPICFFPNKSCYMDFYIELTIFNGFNEETISSDMKNIQFNVSSIDAKYVNFDNSIVDLQEIYNNTEGRYYISYPNSKELNPLNSHLYMN